MYNLNKNEKLLNNVINGDWKPINLVNATSNELASDDLINSRKEREQLRLNECVTTEHIDVLKRASYHQRLGGIMEENDDEKGDEINKKMKKKRSDKEEDDESDDETDSDDSSETDSDEDKPIATNLRKK